MSDVHGSFSGGRMIESVEPETTWRQASGFSELCKGTIQLGCID
jgi:hypothetical protein